MDLRDCSDSPNQAKLLEIIRVQTEIAQTPLELERVMELVADTARRLTDSDGAVVELAEGEDMVYRAAVGMAAGQLGLRIPREGSMSGLTVAKGHVLYCKDSETDDRVNRDACRAVGLRSMVVVPLRYKNESIGVLKVMKPDPDGFDNDDIETMDLTSGLIAAHIAQAAQYRFQMNESETLLRIATHDSLTGLYNRSAFYDHLRRSLSVARRYSESLGVAVLDMDGLKAINDAYGHRAGDLALRTFADLLRDGARESDVAARLGGDEFGILLPRLEDKSTGLVLGRRLAEVASGTADFGGVALPVRSSVGVAVFPEDGEDPEQLVGIADAAMYAMKREHKAERTN